MQSEYLERYYNRLGKNNVDINGGCDNGTKDERKTDTI